MKSNNLRKQLAIPYAIFLVLFVVLPLLVVIYYGFTNGDGQPSFENFINFFKNGKTVGTLIYSFAIAIIILAGIREKIEHNDVPESFKGAPIVLITAGLMAMAFMGLSGMI